MLLGYNVFIIQIKAFLICFIIGFRKNIVCIGKGIRNKALKDKERSSSVGDRG
jgi:hypothetical protein